MHLRLVPNVKVDGYCADGNGVFECRCLLNGHNPIGNTGNFAEPVRGDTTEVAKMENSTA